MVDISFRVTSGRTNVQTMTAGLVQEVMALQNHAMQDIVDKGQVYPPPPGGPLRTAQRGKNGKTTMRKVHRYKRTFILKNSWRVTPSHVQGDVIRGQVLNNAVDKYGAHYASRVYGSSNFDQAPIHQGRWPTRDDLFDRRAYEAELQAIQRRIAQ